jgi:hypothetical protein
MTSDVLDAFYRDVLDALGEWMARPESTPRGAVTVVKRVAVAHGVPVAERLALPRLSKRQMDEVGALGASWRRAHGIK